MVLQPWAIWPLSIKKRPEKFYVKKYLKVVYYSIFALMILLLWRYFSFTGEPQNEWNLQWIFWGISQCISRWLSKMEYSLNPFQWIFLWIFRVCVCVHARVFCLLTLALFEESSITASNQQIYDLYKWIILENQRHCRK